jgi:hypothetical protein
MLEFVDDEDDEEQLFELTSVESFFWLVLVFCFEF